MTENKRRNKLVQKETKSFPKRISDLVTENRGSHKVLTSSQKSYRAPGLRNVDCNNCQVSCFLEDEWVGLSAWLVPDALRWIDVNVAWTHFLSAQMDVRASNSRKKHNAPVAALESCALLRSSHTPWPFFTNRWRTPNSLRPSRWRMWEIVS